MRCGGRREEFVLPHFHNKEDNPSSKAHSFRLLMEETSHGEEVRQQILKFVQDFIFTRCKNKTTLTFRLLMSTIVDVPHR